MCIYRYIVQYDNGVVRRAVASFQGFIAFRSENEATSLPGFPVLFGIDCRQGEYFQWSINSLGPITDVH